MFKLLMYFLFLPFWLIWWFIKLVFYFMAWLEVCLLSFNGKRIIRRIWKMVENNLFIHVMR